MTDRRCRRHAARPILAVLVFFGCAAFFIVIRWPSVAQPALKFETGSTYLLRHSVPASASDGQSAGGASDPAAIARAVFTKSADRHAMTSEARDRR
jgi:hypothetical protein